MSLRPKSIHFGEVWKNLKVEIYNIITCRPVGRIRWNDLFHDIYALCVAIPDPLSEQLYSHTREFLESHVKSLHKEVEKSDELLLCYFERWKIYSKGAEWLQELYRYLNTQFIKKHKFTEADLAYGGIPVEHVRSAMLEIGELALDVWKRLMITQLENTVVSLLLEAISQDREGGSINQPVVFGVIQSLVEVEEYRLKDPLELYETVFERKFLEATSEHFKREASQLISECSCSVYMEKVLIRLQEEDLRSRKFLHPSSYDKLRKLCEKDMVACHMDVMHGMAATLIQNEQKQDLANMYKLLKAIPDGISVLVKEMENHVKTIALNSVANLAGDNVPNQFVENMLSVYHKYSDMVRTVFDGDQEFWGALDKACVAAINHKEDGRSCAKSSEWLAKYTDYLLRKSAKIMTETDTEEKLTYAIVIFRYIEDKDMFQKFYARNLANRLIHSASPHMDNEECMINKLKQACGYEFTSKLHRMFQDIGVSKTLTEQFLSHIASQSIVMESGFNIQVLQAGAWPLSTQSNVLNFSVPVELQPAINAFEQFYNSNFNGRKLTWLYHLATAEVKLNYLPGRTYIITMQVHQAAILLHFNANESATVAELESFTQMEADTLSRTVRSLVEAGVLTSSSGSEVKSDSTLLLNMSFTSKRTKFKLNQVVMQKQVEKEAEHVTSTVQQDRKYYLECIIVRIMKARKVLKHNQLVQEVITQSRTRFTPEIPFIKRTIEQLIEKQFLQRAENADEYAYLA